MIVLCGNCVSIRKGVDLNANLDLWRCYIISLSLGSHLCDLWIMLPLSQFFFVKNEVE